MTDTRELVEAAMHLLSEYDAPNPVDDAVYKLRTEKELNRFDDMSKRQFEAVLCGCMRAGMPLDAVDWDEVGVDRGLVERWWKCHQEEDAARAAKGGQP